MNSSIFSTSFINYLPSINPITKSTISLNSCFPSSSTPYTTKNKREFPLLAVASITYPPINVDYLETEFSGHGVSFGSIGDSYVVRMGLENGSVATLMLPSGLVTSYKSPMWHGGLLELLHTTVSEGEYDGGAVIQGGVSFAFKCQGEGSLSWSPRTWALHDVRGSPRESIQVELICSNSEDKVEVKHIVTLEQDAISSELVITNSKPSSLRVRGSIIGHLAVSTPEATYAMGLERSNFFIRPPVPSNFSIIPPDLNKKDLDSGKLWSKLFSSLGSKNQNNAGDATRVENEKNEVMEGEEEDSYKHLTEKMSMIYTCAPRNFTVIDRGTRNSVVVGREGFDELYMFSPGSSHEAYSKYSYICIGQAALLEPIILDPEAEWRGVQHLHNPNLE